MEFFTEISNYPINVDELKHHLVIKNLPVLCSSITSVLKDDISAGVIYCIWGEFAIHREELQYGVRFSLPSCPNALAWTVTTEGNSSLMIHCTINKRVQETDFIDSINDFIADWVSGLEQLISPGYSCSCSV